jgi:hypothetical protein
MEKLIQQCEAQDENGDVHTLLVYQNEIGIPTRGNPNAVAPGMKRIVTENGETVARIAKGRYRIVQSNIELVSDSPDAP